MVFTRGMARKEPSEPADDLDMPLKKKPIRRATAKTTKPPTKQVTAKSAGTKHTEDGSEVPRITDVQIPKGVASKPTRGRKAAVAQETEMPHEKPKPLSPKKVTQVSRATRMTKASEGKIKCVKSTAKSTTAIRKRGTKKTDENEVIDLESEEDLVGSQAQKAVSPKKTVFEESEAAGLDEEPTAPTQTSPERRLGLLPNELLEFNRSSLVPNAPDTEDEESADELCGPKTPLRRASPTKRSMQFLSAMRSAQRGHDIERHQTPGRRFQDLNAHGGTSRTEQEQQTTTARSSVMRPKTAVKVARGSFSFAMRNTPGNAVSDDDECMVVPDDVANETTAEEDEDKASAAANQGSPADRSPGLQKRTSAIPRRDMSFVGEGMAPGSRQAGGSFEDLEAGDETVLHHETPVDDAEEDREGFYDEEETILMPQHDDDLDITVAREQSSATGSEDEETEEDSQANGDLTTHFPRVLSQVQDQDAPEDLSEIDSLAHIESPSPETLIWERIRDDIAIPVDFNKHLMSPLTTARDSIGKWDFTLNEQIVDATRETQGPVQPIATHYTAGDLEHSLVLDDFIDLKGLSEDTVAIRTPLPARVTPKASTVGSQAVALDGGETPAVDFGPIASSPSKVALKSPASAGWSIREVLQKLNDTAPKIPHYALPTAAFDARRKSLPAMFPQTPVKTDSRPKTSDGATMPRMATSFGEPWWSTPKSVSKVTTPYKSPIALQQTSRGSLKKVAKTTPVSTSKPGSPAKVRPSTGKSASAAFTFEAPAEPAVNTPIPTIKERYPRLAPPKTVAAPPRFHTPTHTPLKRPATMQKPSSLRKAVLRTSTPMRSRTPVKTPLKPAATATPGQMPMTPHPAAPLRGVLALVEVYTLEGASVSAPFIALLHRLGARTTKIWKDAITHVVFKDGSPTTLQRVRLANKDAAEKGDDVAIHCVNSRWITDCDAEGKRMDENDEEYAVDVAEVPRGGKRRRKSMEPAALKNIGGNVVKERGSLGRSSLGRSSLGRTPLVASSPRKMADHTPDQSSELIGIGDKENDGDDFSTPNTPAYIAAPDTLVQNTAPLNRMKKLELGSSKGVAKNRRLTFWSGGA